MTTNTKRAYKLRILVNFANFFEFHFGVAHSWFPSDRSIAAAAVVQPAGRFDLPNFRGSF